MPNHPNDHADLLRRLEASDSLAPLGEVIRAFERGDEASLEAANAALEDFDPGTMRADEHALLAEAVEVIADLASGEMAQLAVEAGGDTLPTAEDIAQANGGSAAADPRSVFTALKTCEALTRQFDGGAGDDARVRTLCQLGFVDSMLAVEDSHTACDEMSRAAAVISAAHALGDAILEALKLLVRNTRNGQALDIAELAEIVDPAAVALFAWFPQVSAELDAELAGDVEEFLQGLP